MNRTLMSLFLIALSTPAVAGPPAPRYGLQPGDVSAMADFYDLDQDQTEDLISAVTGPFDCSAHGQLCALVGPQRAEDAMEAVVGMADARLPLWRIRAEIAPMLTSMESAHHAELVAEPLHADDESFWGPISKEADREEEVSTGKWNPYNTCGHEAYDDRYAGIQTIEWAGGSKRLKVQAWSVSLGVFFQQGGGARAYEVDADGSFGERLGRVEVWVNLSGADNACSYSCPDSKVGNNGEVDQTAEFAFGSNKSLLGYYITATAEAEGQQVTSKAMGAADPACR